MRDVDLDIRDGEFLTLVGPSGCGKSTLLRIIAGLESQSGGHVAIGGRAVDQVRASARATLAMVFQSYALYPHLSVRQNIETPLRLRDLNAWERLPLLGLLSAGRAAKMRRLRAQVAETAEILKIEELMDRKPGQLSGGQARRPWPGDGAQASVFNGRTVVQPGRRLARAYALGTGRVASVAGDNLHLRHP